MTDRGLRDMLKTLPKLTSEPNEVKRYVLLNLWLNQFFTQSIIDPISRYENRLTNITDDTVTSSIYDLCRDIRLELQAKNKQLKEVREKMVRQREVILVLSHTLELANDEQLERLTENIRRLDDLMSTNEVYINRLSDLSESKISLILNDSKSK